MQILGVILVAAMMVVPVAATARVARTFEKSLLLAVLAGEFAGVVGVTVSYRYGLAAGGSIVLTGIALYAVVLAVDALGMAERLPGSGSAVEKSVGDDPVDADPVGDGPGGVAED